MGIELGGADIGVAEQFLHVADVSAVFQQVGGEGMAQAVKAGVFFDAGFGERFGKDHLRRTLGQPAATLAFKQIISPVTAAYQKIKLFLELFRNNSQPVFIAFGLLEMDSELVQLDVPDFERYRLAHPQAGAIGQGNQQFMLGILDIIKDLADFLPRQDDRQFFGLLGESDVYFFVNFQYLLIKKFDGIKIEIDSLRRVILGLFPQKEFFDLFLIYLFNIRTLKSEILSETSQVAFDSFGAVIAQF